MAKIAVIYYSSTGNTYELAKLLCAGAEAAGSTVRLRRARELAPAESVATNPAWERHLAATQHVAEAMREDLEWAEAYAFGSPTRYGSIAAQLKEFIDRTGPLWQAGKLANKAATAFTGAATLHGGHETTLQAIYTTFAHWGSVVVPLGYTAPIIFKSGNPHGTSLVDPQNAPIPEEIVASARWQGERLARIADALVAARDSIAAPPGEEAYAERGHVVQR